MEMRPELIPSEQFVILDALSHSRPEAEGPSALPRYDLMRAMRHVRRRLGLIVICVAVGTFAALIVSIVHKPNYTAAALISVSQAEDDGTGRGSDASVDTQIAMLQSPVFIERAFDILTRDEAIRKVLLRPEDLERRLKVGQVMRSRLVSVNFSANSPRAAAEIANRIARLYVESPHLQGVQSIDDASGTLSERIGALEAALSRVEADTQNTLSDSSHMAMTVKAADLREQIASLRLSQSLARRSDETRQQALALSPPVQLIALASPPARPSSVKPILIVVPAILFSVIFGVALALFLGALDRRIYLPSELAETFRFSSIVGVPPRRRRRRFRAGFGFASAVTVGYSRAVDAVFITTLLSQKNQRSTLLFAASEENDHAFDFVLSFASAAARVRRTLLVDMDSPRRQNRLVGVGKAERERGAFDVLAGFCVARDAIQTVPETRLDYLASGRSQTADTLLLIADGGFTRLLAELRPIYDWIIVLGSPVAGGNDARLIAGAVNARVLLVRAGASTFHDIATALGDLSSVPAPGVYPDDSTDIAAVLMDAPRWSLPAAFRSGRIERSTRIPKVRPIGAPQSASRTIDEESATRGGWIGAIGRLVVFRGSTS